MMTKAPKGVDPSFSITLGNRLRVVMAERGIHNTTAFARAMAERGFERALTNVARYLTPDPPAMSLEFLSAACSVLGCTPNDLFTMEVTLPKGARLPHKLELPQHADIQHVESEGGE